MQITDFTWQPQETYPAVFRTVTYHDIKDSLLQVLRENHSAPYREIAGRLTDLCGFRVSVWQVSYFVRRLCSDPGLSLEERELAEAAARTAKDRKKAKFGGKNDIDRSKVIDNIRLLAEKLGRTPTMPDAGNLLHYVLKYFGRWNAALEAAGLPINRCSLPADESERDAVYKEALRKVADVLGRAPSRQEYIALRKKLHLPNDCVIQQFYGSWKNALRSAGFPAEPSFQELLEEKMKLFKERKCIAYSELPGKTTREKQLAAKTARKSGLMVVRTKAGYGCADKGFATVVEKDFPVIPGKEKGREYAMRVAGGETLESIGRSEGYSRERVRQLIAKYIGSIVHSEKSRVKNPVNVENVKGKVLAVMNRLPTVKEYRQLRREYPGLPSVGRLIEQCNGWPFAEGPEKIKILSALKEVMDNKKRVITVGDYKKAKKPEWPDVDEILKAFGSWRAALYEALVGK